MPEVEIRRLHGTELVETSRQLRAYAFPASPPLQTSEKWQAILTALADDVHLGLFEDRKEMACASFSNLTQNVRGKIVKSGGVWGVATHPSGRRKGYARQILHALFETMRQEEFPFTTLYPFRESFYDRLGYTTFPRPRKIRFPVNGLVGLLKKDLGGTVEMSLLEESFLTWRTYLQKHQAQEPGMALFDEKSALFEVKEEPYWLAVAQANGETVAAMIYQLKGGHGDMEVPRFYYENAQGLYLLLEWIARHADQATTVELRLAPAELPETWLPDLELQFDSFKAPMGRVLDISRIGGLQTGPGKFSARITDPQCPWNEGVYSFETVDGVLRVTPGGPAACDLTIQGLSSLIFGTHRPDSFSIRGWGNPSPETQAVMLSMFPSQLPYLHEQF